MLFLRFKRYNLIIICDKWHSYPLAKGELGLSSTGGEMLQLSAQRDKGGAEREGMYSGMSSLKILLSSAQSLFLTLESFLQQLKADRGALKALN